ncbi:hypothetical protein BJV82DRAFT_676894 [Fennellomyces sp. T-0311]|nr:hypothetical protein BJV82DRAFT_676894 [Fennellomyces sp. T-0311]
MVQNACRAETTAQNLQNEMMLELNAVKTELGAARHELIEAKARIAELSSTLCEVRSQLEEDLVSGPDALTDLPEYPCTDPDENPLAKRKIERTVGHPTDKDGSPRHFVWELYQTLGEEVLKSDWKPVYLTTFKKNITPFADALALMIRKKYQMNPDTTWCDLGKLQQRQANLVLESHIKNEYPLNACAGSWGARLLMVRAFQRTKEEVKEKEGGQKNQSNMPSPNSVTVQDASQPTQKSGIL